VSRSWNCKALIAAAEDAGLRRVPDGYAQSELKQDEAAAKSAAPAWTIPGETPSPARAAILAAKGTDTRWWKSGAEEMEI